MPSISFLKQQDLAMKDLLDWLDNRPSIQAVRFQIETGAAIRRWCLRDLGYKEGDRVRIAQKIDTGSAWLSYNKALAIGATAVVREINFNPYSKGGAGAWHAEIELDEEWWTDLDGERHEVERKHTFSVLVEDVEKVA